MNLDLAVSGQYKITLKHHDNTITETPWFDNMILNNGLDLMGKDVMFLGVGCVGGGSTAVTATQTSLASFIAEREPNGNLWSYENSGAPNYEGTSTVVYSFAQGAVVGNITEVGIGPDFGGANLFSRALVTNSAGQPTAIAVVALDEFTLTYRLKIKPPVNQGSGSFVIGSQTINYVVKIAYADTFAQSINHLAGAFSSLWTADAYKPTDLLIGDITDSSFGGSPSGAGNSSANIVVNNTYVTGTYRRTGTIGWTYANGNDAAGIGGVKIAYGAQSGYGHYQFKYLFSTPIMKTNTQELRLNMTVTWSRG